MTKETALTYKYLQFINYSTLVLWDIKRYSHSSLKYRYDIIPLKDVLSIPKMEWVEIEDEKEYPILGVHAQGEGVYINRVAKGRELTMKQYQRSKPMHLFYCKVRTVNGQWGVVYPEFADSYGSSNMQYLAINQKKLNPKFLELLLRVKSITQEWDKNAVGADGRHFPLKTLLNLTIPLPSLEEQNAIVAAYNNSLALADEYNQQAEQESNEIAMYLLETLGISKPKAKQVQRTSYLEFYNYADIEQWGVDFIRKNNADDNSSLYQHARLSDICRISSGGTPSRGRREYYNGNILWVKTGELKNEVLYDTEEKITKLGLNNSSAKLYPAGSLLIAMYGATIGQTAKLGVEATTNQACAVLFDINNSLVVTDYLWLYVQSQMEKLKSMAYGGAQPNINAGIVANLSIPLPPLAVQNEIVEHISSLREKQKMMIAQSKECRLQAAQQFEKTIFE